MRRGNWQQTFCGTKGSQHRQIGNAVPRRLGAAVARSVWSALYGGDSHV
jgi:site-specific DNA-cytosine methylase